jgi:glycosyltransferase involved in cell wall biosynthesis
MPLVSVVVPTHNRPEFLAEALASIKLQTFTDYEIVVVSNGEKPQLAAASEKIAALAGASWFSLRDGNLSAARNFGIDQAKGEWIAFLDDDDIWLPEKLECQLEEARLTGADMIATDYTEFDQHGITPGRSIGPGRSPDIKAMNHITWWAAPSTVIVRADIVREIKFDPTIARGEDFDLWRRICWRHRIHQMVGSSLVRVRRAHASLTRDRLKMIWCDAVLYRNIWRDTPQDLRWSLPPFSVMVDHMREHAKRVLLFDPWTGSATLKIIYCFISPWEWYCRLRSWMRPRRRYYALRGWLNLTALACWRAITPTGRAK